MNKLGRGLLDDAIILGLVISDKKIFKVFISKIYFSPCYTNMQRTEIYLIFIVEGHIRIIPAKFDENPASSLGGDVL